MYLDTPLGLYYIGTESTCGTHADKHGDIWLFFLVSRKLWFVAPCATNVTVSLPV
jgi:hypothetical protein